MVAPPSTAFNSQFKPSSGALPLWYRTSVTSGFAGSDMKFSSVLVQHTHENNTLAPSQLAGPRDQQRVWDPPCLSAWWKLLLLSLLSSHTHTSPVPPSPVCLSGRCWGSCWAGGPKQSLVACALHWGKAAQHTRMLSTQGCSDSSMCYLGKSKFSTAVLEKCPKSLKYLMQDIHKSFLLQLSKDV